jgi:serine/threonine protein kinase
MGQALLLMSTTSHDSGDLPGDAWNLLDEEGATRLLERSDAAAESLAAASADNEVTPEPATRAVEYRIGRLLGRGGFAEVYEAELVTPGAATGKRVALKRLLPGMRADPMRRRLLIREAHLAAQLVHGNIVKVLDLVNLGDELAIVMELVEGISANHLLHRLAQRSQRLTLGSVAHIMQGLLSALSYLENPPIFGRRPLVHSDISLENVMVTEDGEVKLLDFGIAGQDQSAPAPADDEEGLTSIHQVAGKRSYHPPEGQKGAPSVSGDLYAAGICFWELIAGCRFPVLPPGVSSREIGSLIAFAGEGLPEGVWTTLKLCLSIDPSVRPGTAARCSELMQGASIAASFSQEALSHLVRHVLGKTPADGTHGGAAYEAPAHPRWPSPSEPHDVVTSLVERLHFAFCAHRVQAYEPVPPDEIEDMGGHEFILRSERGGVGEPIPDFLLRETLDGGYRDEDGTLFFRVRPPGAQSHVFVIQPGEGRVYDVMARQILHALMRPEAPPPAIR